MRSKRRSTRVPESGFAERFLACRVGVSSATTGLGPILRRAGWLALAVLLATVATSGRASARGVPWASGASKAEDLEIALVCFDPGDSVAEAFGHAALLVRDRRRHVDRLYNYGLFDFGPDMLPNFARGRLTFWVGEERPLSAYPFYMAEGRGIRELTLNLSPSARLALARDLARAVLPENREYLYDHYHDNCATRLSDAINRATGGQFKASLSGPGRMTLRDHTRRHVGEMRVIEFLMMHAMGGSVDVPITRYEELFLPGELERAVSHATVELANGERGPLVSRRRTLFQGNRRPVPELPHPFWPRTLGIGLGTGALLVALGWARQRELATWRRVGLALVLFTLGISLGFLGTLTTVVSYLTDHQVARNNQNVLLSNPLLLGLCAIAVGALGNRPYWHRWLWAVATAVGGLTLTALLLKFQPWAVQDNNESLTLLVPPHLALAAIAWQDWRSRRSVRSAEPSATNGLPHGEPKYRDTQAPGQCRELESARLERKRPRNQSRGGSASAAKPMNSSVSGQSET